MQALVKGFIAKHTPPVISVLMSIIGMGFYISTIVNDGFVTIKRDLIAEARQPSYEMLQASLDKQLEKLASDPNDIKTADIKLLYNQCNDDFGKIYLKTLPPNEMLSAKSACNMLENEYLKRRTY